MYIYIIIVAISLVLLIGYNIKEYRSSKIRWYSYTKDDFILSFFSWLFIMILILSFTILIHYGIVSSSNIMIEATVKITDHEIVSIKQDGETQGQMTMFIIGSGFINETQYYFFYEQQGKNRYKLNKVPTDNSIIIESDATPSYKYFNYEPHQSCYDWILFCSVQDKYEIYVPFGTIIKDFKL